MLNYPPTKTWFLLCVVFTGGGSIIEEALQTTVKTVMLGEETQETINGSKGTKKRLLKEGGSTPSDLNA